MNLYEYQRSRSFIDLSPRTLRFNILKLLFLRNCLADWTRLYVEPQWDVGTKVWSNGLGHMTKMTAMPIYDKNLKKNHLLWNQKADDLETWSASLGTRVLPSLFNDDPGMTLTFTARSNLVLYAFVWQKVNQWIFLRNCCSLWYKSW